MKRKYIIPNFDYRAWNIVRKYSLVFYVFFANNQVGEPVLLHDLGPLVRYTQSKVTKLECSLIHYIPTMHNRFQAL